MNEKIGRPEVQEKTQVNNDHNIKTEPSTNPKPDTQKSKTNTITVPEDIPEYKAAQVVFNHVFVVDKHYQLSRVIGMGSYGIVASGVNKLNNQSVAIKKSSDIFRDLGDTKRILREIHLLKHVKHKNIIMLLDIVKLDDINTFKDLYLVFQLMDSNLSAAIRSPTPLTEEHIRYLIYQLLNGLYYMHSANIIHRDLKPQNIFVNKKCGLKIGDLNLARKYDENEGSTDYVTTRWYRAPEILLGSTTYTKAIDIWSVGCILAELLGGFTLFKGKDYLDQLTSIATVMGKPKPQDFEDPTVVENLNMLSRNMCPRNKVKWREMYVRASEECLDLLDHMLVYKPGDRYTAQECLNHPYLAKFRGLERTKCEANIDWSFDKIQFKEDVLRKQIYKLAEEFRTEPPQLGLLRQESSTSKMATINPTPNPPSNTPSNKAQQGEGTGTARKILKNSQNSQFK